MIDIHFHCLPGIDDGPSTWKESVELCRAAAAEGTHAIVATPHVMRDPWINSDPARRDELVLKLNDALGGEVAILPGCEYFFSSDAIELWEMESSSPLTALNRGPFLLIEFPSSSVPRNAEAVIHEFAILGIIPVIAHPERNVDLVSRPARLQSLVERGATAQITAGSLLGDFGRIAMEACEEFRNRDLIHFVASDAHSMDRRPPRLAAARTEVETRWGAETAELLFDINPERLLRGVPVRSTRELA